MFFYLKASSKDKEVLANFNNVLSRIKITSITVKYFPKQKNRKIITILNSPHVNKTAQEQFEFRNFNKLFLVHSYKPFLFIMILKNMIHAHFSGLNLVVESFIDSDKNKQQLLKTLNPDNIIHKISLATHKYRSKKKCMQNYQQRYIQLFDSYGEIHLKNYFKKKEFKLYIFSSVG